MIGYYMRLYVAVTLLYGSLCFLLNIDLLAGLERQRFGELHRYAVQVSIRGFHAAYVA